VHGELRNRWAAIEEGKQEGLRSMDENLAAAMFVVVRKRFPTV
jgi:hypothetical protein